MKISECSTPKFKTKMNQEKIDALGNYNCKIILLQNRSLIHEN